MIEAISYALSKLLIKFFFKALQANFASSINQI